METEEFQEGISKLTHIAYTKVVTFMCSEAVRWRCHRSMISDALLINDFIVWDIINENNVNPHSLTSVAKIIENNITYPE